MKNYIVVSSDFNSLGVRLNGSADISGRRTTSRADISLHDFTVGVTAISSRRNITINHPIIEPIPTSLDTISIRSIINLIIRTRECDTTSIYIASMTFLFIDVVSECTT